MDQRMKVEGVAAQIAAGKGTFAKFALALHPGTPILRYSDSLREFYDALLSEYDLLGAGKFPREPSARHEDVLADIMVSVFGPFIAGRFHYRAPLPQINGDRAVYRTLVRFDQWLREEWGPSHDTWAPKAMRSDMQGISEYTRKFFGEDLLEQTVMYRLENARVSGHQLVVIEGIRRLVDITRLREDPVALAQYDFSLTYVEAEQSRRYEWYQMRNENPGDAEMTREQFDAKDNMEPEQQITLLKPRAGTVIDNNGSLVEYYAKLARHFSARKLL